MTHTGPSVWRRAGPGIRVGRREGARPSEGPSSTVVAEDLEVNGMIHCEKSLQVGGHLVCTEGLRAGHGIQVGQSIRSGMHIDAGWGIVAGSDITGEGAIRAGECIVSGGSVRPGAGFSLYAGLSARRDAWPSCGRVVSLSRPENLLSGFWDGVPCGVSA